MWKYSLFVDVLLQKNKIIKCYYNIIYNEILPEYFYFI